MNEESLNWQKDGTAQFYVFHVPKLNKVCVILKPFSDPPFRKYSEVKVIADGGNLGASWSALAAWGRIYFVGAPSSGKSALSVLRDQFSVLVVLLCFRWWRSRREGPHCRTIVCQWPTCPFSDTLQSAVMPDRCRWYNLLCLVSLSKANRTYS